MNHQKEAANIIEHVKDYGEVGSESDLNVALAQTHAILAVAEQLRIGNLIALTQVDPGSVSQETELPSEVWSHLIGWNYEDDPAGMNGRPEFLPQIAEALGIEQP